MKDGVAPPFPDCMRHLIAAALVSSLPAVAHAESPTKDPETAQTASLGATAVPLALGALAAWKGSEAGWVLMGAGLMIGPSAGHWYAGTTISTGLGIRLAGTALAGALLLPAAECAIIGDESGQSSCGLKQGAFLVGVGAVIVGAVHDLATAGDAARRHNARTIQIAPTVVAGARSTTAGLGLSGAF